MNDGDDGDSLGLRGEISKVRMRNERREDK